jgi:hypothetical protein
MPAFLCVRNAMRAFRAVPVAVVLALLRGVTHADAGDSAFPAGALPPRDDLGAPLSAQARQIAERVPDEGTPNPGEHYPVSNEWRHDLWFPYLRELGGAFVGVGTDQCYTLAAVQRADIVWIIDFDPLVPLVHRMYGVLVAESPDPATLISRFAPEHVAETRALLHERLAGSPDRDRIVAMFDRLHPRWSRYLRRVFRLQRDGRPTSWLSDPALYARVRALFLGGRIIARNGDLRGPQTMRAIGAAAHHLGVPVRVLYLSNAEQFFVYTPSFVENVRALPADDRSVVLRTVRAPQLAYPRGDRWHYMVHRWDDFVDRLERGGYRHSRQIVADAVGGRRPDVGPDGLTVIDERTRPLAGSTAQRSGRRARTEHGAGSQRPRSAPALGALRSRTDGSRSPWGR